MDLLTTDYYTEGPCSYDADYTEEEQSDLTTHFSDYSYTEGPCFYEATYPGGVSTNNHFDYSEAAQIELIFGPESTVEQIDYAVRRENERLQRERERYVSKGMSEAEAAQKVVEKHGEIDWGFALLHACNNLVESDCMAQVDYVLSKGADPGWEPDGECDGFLERSPLHVACVQGHLPLLRRLLEAGATPSMKHLRTALLCLPCEEGRRRTPCPLVSEAWDTESSEAIQVLEMLIALVPPGSPEDDDYSYTIIEECEELGNPQAQALLESRGYA